MPAVDRQGQRTADADVVERLALVVRGGNQRAVPVALLHRDLVSERADQFVARRWRQTTELDRGAVAPDRIKASGLFRCQDPDYAVEIRQARMVVVGIALALDRLAGLVADQLEGAGAENVFLVPVRILIEGLFLVDPRIRVGECRQKGVGREFQAEDNRQRIRRLDLVDHYIEALAGAGDALRWVDDFAPARGHVIRGQQRTVVKFDAVTDLEGIGLASIGRVRHLGTKVANKITWRGRVLRVNAD